MTTREMLDELDTASLCLAKCRTDERADMYLQSAIEQMHRVLLNLVRREAVKQGVVW